MSQRGCDWNRCGFIGHRQDRLLSNAAGIVSYPGEKEPWILLQFDMLHFYGIEMFTTWPTPTTCFARGPPGKRWLYQIATHISIDRLRQRARAMEEEVQTPVEESPIVERDRPSPLTIIQ